jgi:hypothetical protein
MKMEALILILGSFAVVRVRSETTAGCGRPGEAAVVEESNDCHTTEYRAIVGCYISEDAAKREMCFERKQDVPPAGTFELLLSVLILDLFSFILFQGPKAGELHIPPGKTVP